MMDPLFRRLRSGDRVAKLRDAGDAARDARKWPAAVSRYRKYLSKQADDWPIRVQLGHALKESGDLPNAEAAYRQAASQAPDDADVHLHVGHILKMTGRDDEARAAYERSAQLAPDGPAAAELLAMSVGPDTPESDYTLGNNARDAHDWAKASDHYRTHLRANPEDGAIWVQFANMRKELGDLNGAERAYRKALALDDTVSDTYLLLGHALKLAGRRDDAIAAYRQAVTLDEDSEAQLELAVLGALPPRTEPEQPAAPGVTGIDTVLMARAARDQGPADEAVALFRRYLSDHDDAGSIWLELAEVLRDANRLHEAFDATERAGRSLGETLPLLREQVMLLRRLGRIEACQALALRIARQTGLPDTPATFGLNVRVYSGCA